MAWSLSENGYNFLKQREGVIYKPIWDRTNYAVGIGHNGPDVNPNKVYTEAEIKQLFNKDKVWAERAANKFPNIQTQSLFDALFSLCYNCGGGIARSGNAIYDAMKNNEHVNNRSAFGAKWGKYKWNNGQLRSRRSAEVSLFYSQAVSAPFNPGSGAGADALGSSRNSVGGSASDNYASSAQAASASATAEGKTTAGSEDDLGNSGNKGTLYPLIKINDTVLSPTEIVEFYVETGWFKNPLEYKTAGNMKTGFVPTMHLVVKTMSPSLVKQDTIKSGDKCQVFFRGGSAAIKSYRGDFVITNVVSDKKPSEVLHEPFIFIIDGELWVPQLRNLQEKSVINGTSRDAMMEIARRLGLGFFFVDPEDTDDYQGWQVQTSLFDAAVDISSRAWGTFDKFYEAFIDPRYGLSFLELNSLLIADGLDELVDLTPFANTIFSTVGVDGKKVVKNEELNKNDSLPQMKILTNIVGDKDSVTPFYIKNWSIVNKAAEMTNAFGIYKSDSINIDNPGVATENTNIDMEYSIPMNQTKLRNGFYVLIGPGVNLTYTQADQIKSSQSFVLNSQVITGGGLTDVMSDGDADNLRQTGSNAMSSGNVNKFYDVGFEHNKKNIIQLEKQYLLVELQGCNVAIMRGEKIPVLLIDNELLMQRTQVFTKDEDEQTTNQLLQKAIFPTASGWYIIDAIKWEWKASRPEDGTNGSSLWRTMCKLKRREWPIVGYQGTDDIVMNTIVNIAIPATKTGKTQEASQALETGNETKESENNNDVAENSPQTDALDVEEGDDVGGEVPLTGLKPQLKDVYYQLKAICPGIKLVSARRWAVDKDGKRVDGNAFLQKNGMYKCVNAKGQPMYFKNNNSRHLYGEAFDIVNGGGLDFTKIMTEGVLLDKELLQTMLDYGISACVETTQDDSGVQTKHYHFGTDPEIANAFWVQTVKRVSPELAKEINAEFVSVVFNRKKIYTQEIKNLTILEA